LEGDAKKLTIGCQIYCTILTSYQDKHSGFLSQNNLSIDWVTHEYYLIRKVRGNLQLATYLQIHCTALCQRQAMKYQLYPEYEQALHHFTKRTGLCSWSKHDLVSNAGSSSFRQCRNNFKKVFICGNVSTVTLVKNAMKEHPQIQYRKCFERSFYLHWLQKTNFRQILILKFKQS